MYSCTFIGPDAISSILYVSNMTNKSLNMSYENALTFY